MRARILLTRGAILGAAVMLALIGGTLRAAEPPAERHWKWTPGGCHQGLHLQPGGPYAVMLFCDDALGDELAVVYLEPMGVPYVDAWKLGDRVWQDPLWARDITSYAWSPGGKRLYVATATVYGSGGLFELELATRGVRQLAPASPAVSDTAPGADYVITGIDVKTGVLYYSPGKGKWVIGRE